MKNTYPRGAVLLLNILVIGTVSIMATAALARGSLSGFIESNAALNAWNTRADIFGCMDEMLIQIQKDNAFTTQSIYSGTATCTVSVTTPSAGTRSIVVSLTEGNNTRKATSLITLDPFAVTQITEP